MTILREISTLSADLQRRLKVLGLRTVQDVFNMRPQSISAQEVKEIQREVSFHFLKSCGNILPAGAVVGNNISDISRLVQHESFTPLRHYSTGLSCIDKLLAGGIPSGCITEIVGGVSSGKTQICLRAAVTCAMNGGKVLFIDCKNSLQRSSLLEIVYSQLSSNSTGDSATVVLDKIFVTHVFDLFTLTDILCQLADAEYNQGALRADHAVQSYDIVIIDGIYHLIAAYQDCMAPFNTSATSLRSIVAPSSSLLQNTPVFTGVSFESGHHSRSPRYLSVAQDYFISMESVVSQISVILSDLLSSHRTESRGVDYFIPVLGAVLITNIPEIFANKTASLSMKRNRDSTRIDKYSSASPWAESVHVSLLLQQCFATEEDSIKDMIASESSAELVLFGQYSRRTFVTAG